jgi:hypothetical protein
LRDRTPEQVVSYQVLIQPESTRAPSFPQFFEEKMRKGWESTVSAFVTDPFVTNQ